jgi:hypothetical protein
MRAVDSPPPLVWSCLPINPKVFLREWDKKGVLISGAGWQGRGWSLGVILLFFVPLVMELDMNGVGGRRGGD